MKAVLARACGGPEVLTFEDVDPPTPEADQVLVEVRADRLEDVGVTDLMASLAAVDDGAVERTTDLLANQL